MELPDGSTTLVGDGAAGRPSFGYLVWGPVSREHVDELAALICGNFTPGCAARTAKRDRWEANAESDGAQSFRSEPL